jgi:hypothetical protein
MGALDRSVIVPCNARSDSTFSAKVQSLQLPISWFHSSHASLRAKRLGLLSFHRENHLGGKGISRPIVVAMTSKLRARSACVSPAANRPATA